MAFLCVEMACVLQHHAGGRSRSSQHEWGWEAILPGVLVLQTHPPPCQASSHFPQGRLLWSIWSISIGDEPGNVNHPWLLLRAGLAWYSKSQPRLCFCEAWLSLMSDLTIPLSNPSGSLTLPQPFLTSIFERLWNVQIVRCGKLTPKSSQKPHPFLEPPPLSGIPSPSFFIVSGWERFVGWSHQ